MEAEIESEESGKISRSRDQTKWMARLPLSRPVHWPDTGDRYVRRVSIRGVVDAGSRACVVGG